MEISGKIPGNSDIVSLEMTCRGLLRLDSPLRAGLIRQTPGTVKDNEVGSAHPFHMSDHCSSLEPSEDVGAIHTSSVGH